MNRTGARLITAALSGVIALGPLPLLARSANNQPLPVRELPIKPEKNPPGDIPDNQVFIRYHSPLGFMIKVPEGWALRQTSGGAIFSDKYNTIALAFSSHADSVTVASIKQKELGELEKTGRAVRVSRIKSIKLPSGSAVVVSYGSNSEPNPVTNKAIRLENDRYFIWKNGKLVTLTMSAPYGADNVDQWNLMAKSFRWQ